MLVLFLVVAAAGSYETCASDADCAGGETCSAPSAGMNKQCRAACATGDTCPLFGQTPVICRLDSLCALYCDNAANPCQPRYSCVLDAGAQDGVCQQDAPAEGEGEACACDADCAAGKACAADGAGAHACVTACTSADSTCPAGLGCTLGPGEGLCLADTIPKGDGAVCTDAGECASGDCGLDAAVGRSLCRRSCAADADCATAGTACVSGRCEAPVLACPAPAEGEGEGEGNALVPGCSHVRTSADGAPVGALAALWLVTAVGTTRRRTGTRTTSRSRPRAR